MFGYDGKARELVLNSIVTQNNSLIKSPDSIIVPESVPNSTPALMCKCGHPLACHAFEGCKCMAGDNTFCECLASHDRTSADEVTCEMWKGVEQNREGQ